MIFILFFTVTEKENYSIEKTINFFQGRVSLLFEERRQIIEEEIEQEKENIEKQLEEVKISLWGRIKGYILERF